MAGITDEQRELALSMARNGQGRNAIARVTGMSAGSVTKVIHDAGLTFDRSSTEQATKTRKVELAEKRSQLELAYLNDAAKLRAQVWAETDYAQPVGGQEPRVMRWTMSRPVPADQLKLIQASTMAVAQSQKIADAASDQGTEAAKSMLANLMEGLGGAWRDLQASDTQPQETSA